MPRGPKGQKRPADVIGNAVRVMEIATGQRGEEFEAREPRSVAQKVFRAIPESSPKKAA